MTTIFIALLFLGASCGGGGGSSVRFNPEETTPTRLVSADGLITAIIPAGAVSIEAEFHLVNRTESDGGIPGPVGRALLVSLEFSAEDKSEPVATPPTDGGTGDDGNGTSQATEEEPTSTGLTLTASVDIIAVLSSALPVGKSLAVYSYNPNSVRFEEAGFNATVSESGLELEFALASFGRFAVYGLTAEELPPSSPGAVSLTAASTQIRKLAWSMPTGALAAGVNLYRSVAGADSFSKVNSEALNSGEYIDYLSAPGGFEYYLTAVNTGGLESEPGPTLLSPNVDFDLLYQFGTADLVAPVDLALSPKQNLLLVSDPGAAQVWVFDLEGNLVQGISHYGNAPVIRPAGIAFNPAETRIYIADSARYGIYILATDFALISYFGGTGEGPGNFQRPEGVGVIFDPLVIGDTVIVTDARQHTIQTFTGLGVYLDTVAEEGIDQGFFTNPQNLLVTETKVYASDAGNARIQVMTTTFEFETPIELAVENDGPLDTPMGLAQDFRDRLYVCDSGNRRVVVFNASGELLFHFGAQGDLRVEFADPQGPQGIAYDETTGYLYVSDPGNNRIVVFTS